MKKLLIIGVVLSSIFLIACSFVDLSLSINPNYSVKGIDISHHNKVTDWGKVKSESEFCIIKATEGSKFKDPKFTQYWSESKKHKIVRGAYHFFSPDVSAEKQFANFKSSVFLNPGDLPPVLDVELMGCDMNEVNKWLKLAEAHYKVKPIIYSEHLFFKIFMEGKVSNEYPLWIYVDEVFKVKPSYSNYNCIFWQYSHTGEVNGINGEVDLDMFMGDRDIFNSIKIK
jgi:lysozyme